MIDQIIAFSIRQKLIVMLAVIGLIGWGIYNMQRLPIDAVPDITDNQVQVITNAPTLAAQEVEQLITLNFNLLCVCMLFTKNRCWFEKENIILGSQIGSVFFVTA